MNWPCISYQIWFAAEGISLLLLIQTAAAKLILQVIYGKRQYIVPKNLSKIPTVNQGLHKAPTTLFAITLGTPLGHLPLWVLVH